MTNFTGIADAADAARNFMITNGATLPDHVRDKVLPYVGTGSSPVDLVVHFAEAIYANRDDEAVSAEAREIAAGCALLAESFGFHGLNQDGRGSALAAVMLGQKVKAAPEPKAEYNPPAQLEPASAPIPAAPQSA